MRERETQTCKPAHNQDSPRELWNGYTGTILLLASKISQLYTYMYSLQYGFETDLYPLDWNHTEKSCIASYYSHFSTNIKIRIIRLIPVLLAWPLAPRYYNKTGFNLIIFRFDIRGKLSIIRCNK